MKKIIFVSILIYSFVGFAMNPEYKSNEYEVIAIDKTEAYDEFDCIADDLDNRGLTVEKPQELSTAVIYARKIGGALFMKYLAVKGWTQKMWDWCFEKSKSNKHNPSCVHYKAS